MTKKNKKKKEIIQKNNSSIENIYSSMIEKPKTIPFITLFIIALLSGLIGGFGGDYLSLKYNIWNISNTAQNIQTDENTTVSILPTQEAIPSIYDQTPSKIEENIRSVQKSILTIFEKRNSSPEGILNQTYLPTDVVGQAFVLTNDGWIMTSAKNISDPTKKYVAIDPNNRAHDITDITIDSFTGTAFFKIKSINLSVAKFNNDSELNLADDLIVFNSQKSIAITNIHSPYYTHIDEPKDLIRSSEKYYQFISLDKNLDPTYMGSPVLNSKGEIMGIVYNTLDEKTIVMPMLAINPVITNIFRTNKPTRPFLGINFIDLSELVGTKTTNVKAFTSLPKGALLYDDVTAKVSATIKDSPAEKAGLRAEDVILKVEQEEVDEYSTIVKLIQEYPVGETITLTVLRDHIEQKIPVILEEVK